MATNRWIPIVLAVLLLVAAGCSAAPTVTPVPKRVGESLPPTSEPASRDPVELDAIVEQVDILLKESYPVQVDLLIRGYLPDSCSVLDLLTQEVVGDRIVVSVVTTRPADAVCTQALEPFEVTFPLDLSELTAGSYTIDVNGVEEVFVVDESMVGPTAEEWEEREAQIEEVRLRMTRSIPAQVIASIQGYLPGGCAELGEITQWVEGDRIHIRVLTRIPVGVPCTLALVGFTEQVPVETEGLEPGTYIVDVNGVETELVWEGAMVGPQVGEYLYGDALVDTFQVQIMESMPVQIALVIEGNFRDGCTELSEITQEVRGDRIVVQVRTQRPKDAMCTQALVPYSERYRLDLTDIEPGTYTLEVNGITETLELEAAMLGR